MECELTLQYNIFINILKIFYIVAIYRFSIYSRINSNGYMRICLCTHHAVNIHTNSNSFLTKTYSINIKSEFFTFIFLTPIKNFWSKSTTMTNCHVMTLINSVITKSFCYIFLAKIFKFTSTFIIKINAYI